MQMQMLKVQPESSVSPESMEEDQEPTSPFWIQTTTRIQRLYSLFFNSFVLIIFLLLFALISILFIIPSLLHISSNIFRPNLVKTSWDSLNLILVFIALVFGFLSRNISSNDQKLDFDNDYDSELPAGAPIMYDLQDQSMNSVIGLRRQRTSISYPDLRELSPHCAASADPWRFSDDTHLNYYNVLESNRNSFRQQPANTVKQKIKKVNRSVAIDNGETERSSRSGTWKILSPEQKGGRSENRRARSSEPRRLLSPVINPLPDPTSPPPVSPSTERKRDTGDATKEFFTSFHHKKKKKKRQRDRSVDNLGSLLHHSQPPPAKFQPPAPAPPPPPPEVPHNFFSSEKQNRKKIISVTLPPSPPPPPPPAAASVANFAPRATITQVAPFVTGRPGGHWMTTGFTGIDDSSSGGESPMKQIPPPPPLPPFKMPEWKFAVEGDFVRLQSTLSSRSVSPDGDEARSPSSDVDTAAPAGFWPSADVDTKADSFIARFRAGLKLERMSKLGPGPSES